ncbi:MAG: RHS repeat-associated core domain-containing protein [Bacteroidetes bacterium]|nr:RHS repeat-associated core domain-containing protein [Bacteroidota bacterium]
MRTGPVHRARKLHLHHRLVPARSYTYYPAGNLLTDSYRNIFQSTMGRANLPFTLMKDIQGAQYREAYLYNTADQRIYKEEDRYAQGSWVSQVVTSEFHLLDAGGHDLGVLDLNTGKWEWYIFGAQRFAKLTPANDQQPAFVSTDLSGLAPEPKPGEVELENLLNCLGSLVGNTQLYPLTLVRYKTGETEPVKYDEQSVFNAIPASAQATIIPVDRPLSFRSGKDRLTLSTDPRSSYSIDALMKMAMQRNGPISFPFAYTYPANTALNKVTYYEHDHLGNLRVAFTPVVDCSNPTGTEPDPGLNHPNSSFTLDQVVDYFPYGKILRQYVASGGPERYLTTQHERDQETGLDYRGARYYDSDVARFLSLDPKAYEYLNVSPYNYVGGNPISLIDPDGRGWWDVIVGGATAVAENAGVSPLLVASVKVLAAPTLSNVQDFQRGQILGDHASYALGTMMEIDGARNVATGLLMDESAGASLVLTGGLDAEVAVPVAAVGGVAIAVGTGEGLLGTTMVQNARQNLMAGRGSNKRTPDKGEHGPNGPAQGDHTVVDQNGSTTYTANPRNPSGWDEVKRTDVKGRPHTNPDGTVVPTPHTKEKGTRGIRPSVKGKDY